MSAIEKMEDLVSFIKDYMQTRIELFKLKTASVVSKLISTAASFLIFSFFILLFIIFFGIAASLFIGEKTGSMPLGFLITGGAFFLLGLIVWLGRERWIRIPLMNALIRLLQATENEDE
jgi:hypothetical protein